MPLAGKGKGEIMSSQFQKNIAMPSHTILSIDNDIANKATNH